MIHPQATQTSIAHTRWSDEVLAELVVDPPAFFSHRISVCMRQQNHDGRIYGVFAGRHRRSFL